MFYLLYVCMQTIEKSFGVHERYFFI